MGGIQGCKNRNMHPLPFPGWKRRLQLVVLAMSTTLVVACGGGGGSSGSSSSSGSSGSTSSGSTSGGSASGGSGTTTSSLVLTLPTHGITAANLAVVAITGDANSQAMASYYQQKRGVPAANMINVTLPSSGDTISDTDFAAVRSQITAQMPANAQAVLLAWGAGEPSRVVGTSCSMSITSAVTFGYSASYCSNAGSSCIATTNSPYFDSETTQPFTDLSLRPTMMLGTSTLAEAQTLIDRGVSGDASAPSGTGWLMRTSDTQRSVRYSDYTSLPASWQGLFTLNYVDNSAGSSGGDTISNQSNVMFYFTGLPTVANLATNTFRPGAIGDTLTSFGGVLPSGHQGQITVLDWLNAGLTASYGSVEEPCNFTQKFSQASVLLDHYWRGDTLIEAYWKSVQEPGEGLFVGEPLSHPWPDAASLAIAGGQYQISTRSLRPRGTYTLDYLGSDGSWHNLGTFTGTRAGAVTLTAPLAPSTATKLRWTGPCASNEQQACTLATSS